MRNKCGIMLIVAERDLQPLIEVKILIFIKR